MLDGLLDHVGSDIMHRITEDQLEKLRDVERINSGTAWTHNKFFDDNGYFLVKNLWDPDELYSDIPDVSGQYHYQDENPEHFTHDDVEKQVQGSTSRYWHPQYRLIHIGLRPKLEKIIGRKLYTTYYYDRFYFPGQELEKHCDRDACEISVSIHIGTNLEGDDANWPLWIKTPDVYTDKKKKKILVSGDEIPVVLNPGDGMLYKGCERPHWRDPMPVPKKKIECVGDVYYHQIFFHYVLQDGQRAHCAWDRG